MSKLAVMLDPGHGLPADPGACGNGLKEADINWQTAIEVKALLDARGINCKLSRTENENPTLQERAARSASWGSDIVISIHHNAGGGVGFEIYKSIKHSTDDRLAELLAKEFKAIGQAPHGQGIFTKILSDKSDYYGILRYCALHGVPAIICEYAYLDSADFDKINSKPKTDREAEAIAKAVCVLCGVVWDVKDDITSLLDGITAKGVQFDFAYWDNVLRGKETAKAEYLTVLLQRMIGQA